MTMKSWVLHRVQGLGGVAGRGDLPPRERGREPDLDVDSPPTHGDSAVAADALRPGADLGVYAPLINAVRDELEHFVVSHVRLHVVIADRDRFLLTSIGVRSPGGAEARELLRQFMHEFKPEQVKRYLAREVIGRLPNAGVIDLSLFGGLSDLDVNERERDDGEYRELLAALRTTPATAIARPYEVSVLGRWSETDAPSALPFGRPRGGATPSTPLAGRAISFDVTDGSGTRVAVLHSVVPGRRYVIGKDEGSDLRAFGTYTSRRHAEIWLESDGWHVADAGSTNGIRVVDERSGRTGATAEGVGDAPLHLGEGMRVVLSARAEGPPADYPSISLHASPTLAASTSPAMPGEDAADAAVPKTPLTSVLAVRSAGPCFEVAISQAAGERRQPIAADRLPFTIGRSRDQTLVIDRRHAGVSGHHVVIDALDDDGVRGVVEGDNGVIVDGVRHETGARFAWRPGQTMVLGGSLPDEPPCSLVLARTAQD
ncbi:MAG TPA: FHA domain-containing protein [Caldimonas sp.]|jgi:pSer/pThr/pTyr-binding forkhead associated (FHA) protein|nr:FHA domain-containing protein [Caldimonas sp.]HEX4234832.1 FHA domain-containing protein [Caldimonas sp.]